MKLLDALRRPGNNAEATRYTPPAWLTDGTYLPFPNPFQPNYTLLYGNDRAEPIGDNFCDYVTGGLQRNGVIWAIERVRISLFSEARFQFQKFAKGRPSALYGNEDLTILEHPWEGGTTGDLLARMLLDADFAGNYFGVELHDEVVRLRPDWVEIVLTERLDTDGRQVGWEKLGYLYYEGGKQDGLKPAVFTPEEVVHFAPFPDPLASWRGMSWITPVVREIMADGQATKHKLKWFENAAPQPYDAGVLTPDGWTQMGDIQLGDRVFGPDGKPRHVIGVFPQGERDIYKVTFSSGASTECTEDHLWTVADAYDRKNGTTRTLPLAELVKRGIRFDSGPYRWSVPLVDPLEFDDPGELPIHPYLLGSLLGDGSFRSNGKGSGGVSLASHRDDADEQERLLSQMLPEGVSISRRDREGWAEFYFSSGRGAKPNPLTQAVRALGLFDVPGREKHIPAAYLHASVGERVALLQGLIDTDGSVQRKQRNTVRFDSTSEQLAQQLAELAGGLGAVVKVSPVQRAGEGRNPQWHVSISRLPEWIIPVRLSRKVEIYSPKFRGNRVRFIQSVEYVGRKPAQCIRVDSEDHLYVTDDFILTHNTPNLAISLPKEISPGDFTQFVDQMESSHTGVDNAHKTLYVGGGADVSIVGANMQQMDFKITQGAGESRLAAAGGIHPTIVGLSEGLQGSSLNSGNFGAARRLVADATLRPLWRNAAGSLEVLVKPPKGSRLWFDVRDVAFLREDAMDAAKIVQIQASVIGNLVREGFEPESAIAAVITENMDLLVHSGLLSVQLQPPGMAAPLPGTTAPVLNGRPAGLQTPTGKPGSTTAPVKPTTLTKSGKPDGRAGRDANSNGSVVGAGGHES